MFVFDAQGVKVLIEEGEEAFKAAGCGDLRTGEVGPIDPSDLVLRKHRIDRERDLFGDFAKLSSTLFVGVDEETARVHHDTLAAKVLYEFFERFGFLLHAPCVEGVCARDHAQFAHLFDGKIFCGSGAACEAHIHRNHQLRIGDAYDGREGFVFHQQAKVIGVGCIEIAVRARQEVACGLDTTIPVEDILVQDIELSLIVAKDHDVFSRLYGAKIHRIGSVVVGFVVASVFESDGSMIAQVLIVKDHKGIIVADTGVLAFLGIEEGVVGIVSDGGLARARQADGDERDGLWLGKCGGLGCLVNRRGSGGWGVLVDR